VAEVRSKACTSPGFAYPYVLLLLAVLKKKLNKPREALASNSIFFLFEVRLRLCIAQRFGEDYHGRDAEASNDSLPHKGITV